MPEKLIEFRTPKEYKELTHKRVQPFLDKYIREEQLKLRVNHKPFPDSFGIKELAYSCYVQGLRDADEVIKNQS